MHPEAFLFLATEARALGRRRGILEIGARVVNGSPRWLFEGPYVGVDVAGGVGVDVIADGSTVTPPIAIDTVICAEVLEHAPSAGAIVARALELLEPRGVLLVTCAAPGRAPHSGVDGLELRPGESYANVSAETLEAWVADAGGLCVRLEYWPDRGDLYARIDKPAAVGAARPGYLSRLWGR